jgi:hypothetical protein
MCGAGVVVAAEPTVGWRGAGSGRYPDVRPPIDWSTEQNIVWKTELQAESISSPIVVGDSVFSLAHPSELLCLDAGDGHIVWQRGHTYADVFGEPTANKIKEDHRQAGEIEQQLKDLKEQLKDKGQAGQETPDKERAQIEERISRLEPQVRELTAYPLIRGGVPGMTASTPVSDGQNVFCVFATGIVSSHGMAGKRQWIKFIEAPGNRHTASPLLVDGLLLVHLAHITALDPKTGETVWQTKAAPRLGTSVAVQVNGRHVVVTPNGDVVRVSDGARLADGLFKLAYCSPIAHQGVVYAMEEGQTTAVRLEADDSGGVRAAVLWQESAPRSHRLGSPVYHDGLLYSATENGILSVNDAASGKLHYRQRLNFKKGRIDPSLALAGEWMFISNNHGETVIVRPGPDYQELGRNQLENFNSSPFFQGNRIYIRTQRNLYCIGD